MSHINKKLEIDVSQISTLLEIQELCIQYVMAWDALLGAV